MTTLKINIHELNPSLIRDLKLRFHNAAMEITIFDNEKVVETMNEARFWEIIALFDWTQSGNNAAVIEKSVLQLSLHSKEDIGKFADILSEKLWLLDTEAHAKNAMDKHPKGHLSVDDFLYVRCCVVANGKKIFK
jgi:Protein of unknown function (DUF4240)